MIAEWPIAVLVLCSVTAVVCTVAGLLVGNLPDFSEPLMVSPYRWYVNMNIRKSHGPTSDMFFLPYKMSLYFLPSLPIEAARQDSKSRRTLKPLEKMTMFISDLLSLTHIFTACNQSKIPSEWICVRVMHSICCFFWHHRRSTACASGSHQPISQQCCGLAIVHSHCCGDTARTNQDCCFCFPLLEGWGCLKGLARLGGDWMEDLALAPTACMQCSWNGETALF